MNLKNVSELIGKGEKVITNLPAADKNSVSLTSRSSQGKGVVEATLVPIA